MVIIAQLVYVCNAAVLLDYQCNGNIYAIDWEDDW